MAANFFIFLGVAIFEEKGKNIQQVLKIELTSFICDNKESSRVKFPRDTPTVHSNNTIICCVFVLSFLLLKFFWRET